MAKRYLNNDIPLNDVPADAVDVTDLKNMIVAEGLSVIETYPQQQRNEFRQKVMKGDRDVLIKECIVALLNDHTGIRADLGFSQKALIVGVSTEDTIVGIYAVNGAIPFVGYQQLNNGVGLFGAIVKSARAGKTYHVVFYSDRDVLRAYVPKHGNLINLDCNSIFGDELESGDFDDHSLASLYKLLGAFRPDSCFCYKTGEMGLDWAKMYAIKYGYKTMSRVTYNWNALYKEITKVFVPNC